jgi:hypothetical protein
LTWQFLGALEQPLPEPEEVQKMNGDVAGDGEWEDDDDDDEDDGARMRKARLLFIGC